MNAALRMVIFVVFACGSWLACSDGPSMASGGGATGVVGISGLVLNADGRPASGARVVLRAKGFVKALPPDTFAKTGAEAGIRKDLNRDSADGLTGEDGRFRIDGIDTGEYSLEVRIGSPVDSVPVGAWQTFHADGKARWVELPARRAEALGGLRGSVTGPGGVGVGGFVQILGLDRLAPCDSAGRFSFVDLPAGSFRLRAVSIASGALPTLTGEIRIATGVIRDEVEIPVASGTLALDAFESDSVRAVSAGDPAFRLWTMSRPPEDPDPAVFPGDAHDGSRSLRAVFSSDSSALHFHPSLRSPETWFPMHNYLSPAATWKADTYDRLRFWIKVPMGLGAPAAGGKNLEVGVYIRRSDGDTSTATDGGGLFHHQFDIPATGEWHQVILDTHPGQETGMVGDEDPGSRRYPTGETGFNYFDAMTGFYVRANGLSAGPAEFRVDGFEVFHSAPGDDDARVYGLHGVWVPGENRIRAGWRRHKYESGPHEVRYAFRSVRVAGWSAALPAPDGTIEPPGTGGYNGMSWSTDAIDVAGMTRIFVAIRPVGAKAFREIEIPLLP